MQTLPVKQVKSIGLFLFNLCTEFTSADRKAPKLLMDDETVNAEGAGVTAIREGLQPSVLRARATGTAHQLPGGSLPCYNMCSAEEKFSRQQTLHRVLEDKMVVPCACPCVCVCACLASFRAAASHPAKVCNANSITRRNSLLATSQIGGTSTQRGRKTDSDRSRKMAETAEAPAIASLEEGSRPTINTDHLAANYL